MDVERMWIDPTAHSWTLILQCSIIYLNNSEITEDHVYRCDARSDTTAEVQVYVCARCVSY